MDDGSSPLLTIIFFIIALIELIIIIVFYRKARQEKVTEEDIISMVNEGHEDGNILASEATMIQNIFEFSDTDVKDIMVRRKNIVAIECKTLLKDVITFVNENNFSRYPVYDEELDNIIGIIHIKDLFKIINSDNMLKPIGEIEGILSEVESVTETHSINALFAKMQSKKRHMVIVIDEYGQVSGLLSMEDILEEIVGNIEDEHDDDEASIEKNVDDTYLMDGTTTIEEAEEILHVHLTDDFETLNGYLVSLFGKIPEDGSSFTLEDDNFVFEIKNVSSKVIDQVLVRPKQKAEEA